MSGGEPTLQHEFAIGFLTLCKEKGIHTAMETNMSQPWHVIEPFISLIDYWMCDLKIADSDKHQYWTGIRNESILENIRHIGKLNIPLEVRVPVIPGVNDTEEDIRQICEVLAPYARTTKCKLLGFHTLGFTKFDTLGMKNELADKECLAKDKLELLKETVNSYHLLYE